MNDCIDHGQGSRPDYALDSIKIDGKWRTQSRHRKVYCEANGLTLEDIKGKVVRHKCDNRRWVPIPAMHMGAWLWNLKDVWPVPAQWTEAFEYPVPSTAILYVQRVMGADNA